MDSVGPRSECAFAVRKQNHLILKNISVERKCLNQTAHVQDDVTLYVLHMLEGPFSLDLAHIV